MGRFSGIFSFLTTGSKQEEVVAEYVIREHHSGRALSEILEDAYVTNRISPEQVKRLLDRPDILRAVGEDMAAAQRTADSSASQSSTGSPAS